MIFCTFVPRLDAKLRLSASLVEENGAKRELFEN